MTPPSPLPPLPQGPTTSRTGRIISTTAKKLSAPASTFIKTIRPNKAKSKKTVPSSSATSNKHQLPGTSTTASFKQCQVLISDDKDNNGSSNGDVLKPDSDVLMELVSASKPGSEKDTAISVEDSEVEEPENDNKAELGE
jgi:hypothetical protein